MDLENRDVQTAIASLDAKSNRKSFKRSVRSYAISVFQESTIGIVASIASSHSKARRCLKSLLLTLCVAGFLYQCSTFIMYILGYPTVINIDMLTAEGIPKPAYTLCINNGIKRSTFCELNPEFCYKPNEKFCSLHPSYCGGNETLIPKQYYYHLAGAMDFSDILKWGSNMRDFIENSTNSENIAEKDIEGPYLRLKDEVGLSEPIICYSIFSVVHNNNLPARFPKEKHILGFVREPDYILWLNVDESEILIPGSKPGIFFEIHSPFEAVNPVKKGIFLEPGKTYRIYISMTQDILLKEPFPTKCIDYEERWEANGRSGPRNQEMCRSKCISELCFACFNCEIPIVLYPSGEKMCNNTELQSPMKCTRKDQKVFRKCYKACSSDCRTIKYKLEIRERYDTVYGEKDVEDPVAPDEGYNPMSVEIFLETDEVLTHKHSPKYLDVEIYSAIGGFLGCWLGISLMDIIDFFGSVFIVSSYSWRKAAKK